MPLPNDFDTVLATIQGRGIIDEDEEMIDKRLTLAVQSAAIRGGQYDLSASRVGDSILGTVRKLKAALHQEMCNAEKKELKDDYKDLLDKALSPEGITAVGAVITGIIATINPALAVSNVIVFLSIWLLRRGLNRWCSLPS